MVNVAFASINIIPCSSHNERVYGDHVAQMVPQLSRTFDTWVVVPVRRFFMKLTIVPAVSPCK